METEDLPPKPLCRIVHRPLAGSLPGSFPFYRETVTKPHRRAGGLAESASGTCLDRVWRAGIPQEVRAGGWSSPLHSFVTCRARGDSGFQTCCRRRNQTWPFLSSFLHLHRFPPAHLPPRPTPRGRGTQSLESRHVGPGSSVVLTPSVTADPSDGHVPIFSHISYLDVIKVIFS